MNKLCWEIDLQSGGRKKMKNRKKRDIHKCLLFYPQILEPLCCSFPEEEDCGKYMKIIPRKKGLKTAISLCKYRCKEIGRKTCIREQLKLKDSAIYR